MHGIGRFVLPLMIIFAAYTVRADDDCVNYKLTPTVNVSAPSWTKSVVQPLTPMESWHGNVLATFAQEYSVRPDIIMLEDGYCVALRDIDVEMGYSDFLVHIDIGYTPGSCAYNAVLNHEDEHIRTYLSVVDDYMDKYRDALHRAADAVMPIFVENKQDIDVALDAVVNNLKQHPELTLIVQEMSAQTEIRNRRVDAHEDGTLLRGCELSR